MHSLHSYLTLNSVAHKFTPFRVTSALSPLLHFTILECLRCPSTGYIQRPRDSNSVLLHMMQLATTLTGLVLNPTPLTLSGL